MAKAELEQAIRDLGLTIESTFIPWSQSRNKGEKTPSLNWKVEVKRHGNHVLHTDYMAGCGHCPSYKQGDRTLVGAETVKWECENGVRGRWIDGLNSVISVNRTQLEPDATDVIYSLASDCDVLEYGTFEEWAENFGYDPDSRKAEKIYRQCLQIALKLNNAIGSNGLHQLREAAQDY